MTTPMKSLSLTEYFEPPEGYVGEFGWVYGYSADGPFMDSALDRFTNQTKGQRAWQGKIKLALMLDPGNPQLSTLQVPGLAHLPINDKERPFKLMHAKVAFLHFRNGDDWAIRLLVSTGNWTRQTVEESLDLAWNVTVFSRELDSHSSDFIQKCSDVTAAWEMHAWLQGSYSVSQLTMNEDIKSRVQELLEKIEVLAPHGNAEPRFIHTKNESLLNQLSEKVTRHAGSATRNAIAFGSGFYETVNGENKLPLALEKIVNELQEKKLLTAKPYKEVFVNRNSCQGIATAFDALMKNGYKIYPAAAPKDIFGEYSRRTLHAKFLLGYGHRDNSNWLNNAWIYLGSGNITKPGFLSKASAHFGNVEAGIIDAIESCGYEANPKTVGIESLLPVQWDEKLSEPAEVAAGSEMEEREDAFTLSPVEYLNFNLETKSLFLPSGVTNIEIEVINPITNESCEKQGEQFIWLGESTPRVVRILWVDGADSCHAEIPVVDSFGRIAATELPSLNIDDAWWQLAGFPLPPDTPDSEEESEGAEGSFDTQLKIVSKTESYPVRKMMELIENIAQKQTALNAGDWNIWCERLRQTLIQAKDAPIVEVFRQWEVNPLSALYAKPFRPEFAEGNGTDEGLLYKGVLDSVCEQWRVSHMMGLDGEYNNEQ